MRGTELYRGFVPQSEDSYISSNRLYWAFEGRRSNQVAKKIVLGRHRI